MDLNEIPINKLYDYRLFINCDLISILTLIIYFPIGFALIAVRSLLLLVLYILLQIAPNLSNNKIIIQFLLFAFSLRIHFKSDESRLKFATFKSTETKILPKLIVCNYTSPFDYLIVKSLINSVKQLNNESVFSLAYSSDRKQLSSVNSKEPVICFPELQNTNGEYGLLEFQFKREDIANISNASQILLLSIKYERNNILPINENFFYSSNTFVNILIHLFHPFKCVYVGAVKDEINLSIDESEESVIGFNKSLQSIIARDLKLVATKYSYKDVQKEMFKPQVIVRPQQMPTTPAPQNLSNESRFNRILSNVKEVLPDATSDEVRKSIDQAKSYDIDTLIANILDVRATQPVREPPKQQISTQNSNSSYVKVKNPYAEKLRHLNYKQRKELLIAEARQRYILKHGSNY